MAKYLHLFDTAGDFQGQYYGSGYTEPWVSLTDGEETGITTAFTMLHDFDTPGVNIYKRYVIDELFVEPQPIIDENLSYKQAFAKYKAETNPENYPPAYLLINPSTSPCSENSPVLFYGVSPYEPEKGTTFYSPADPDVSNCSAGTVNPNKVNYNKKPLRIVAEIDGWTHGADGKMTILEDTLPELPFFVKLDSQDKAQDVYYSFTVNGTTYEGNGGLMLNDWPGETVLYINLAGGDRNFSYYFKHDNEGSAVYVYGGIG